MKQSEEGWNAQTLNFVTTGIITPCFPDPCFKHSIWFLANMNVRSLSAVTRPSVCLSSVTFVRPTQAVQIFGSISTALGTLVIHWHPLKISRRHKRGIAKYIAVLDLSTTISRKQCKTGGKLVLITYRKLYMSFRLVSKSVTLNDLERHNGVILRYFSEFG